MSSELPRIKPPPPPSNPYAPPSATVLGVGGVIDQQQAEKIRRSLIGREAGIRSIGFVLYLIAGFWLLLSFTLIAAGVSEGYDAALLGTSGFLAAGGIFFLWVGRGLRRLDPRVRVVTTILAVIGLPFTFIISLYALYQLHADGGKRVMSAEYHEIRKQTPHIKYRTSWVAWMVLAILASLILFGIIAAMLE